ncbi:MAG: LemA family protein [Candidatus Desulfacyla sp.]
MIAVLVLIGIILVLAVWAVGIYNSLVRNRNLVKEGWSGMEVQLKRRADLIPNLIETVKAYMGHERGVLEKVTELRAQSLHTGSVEERAKLEGALSRSLASLFAVAEGYPDLKANQNFLDLQTQLSQLEEQIQMARRYYNGTVRDYNIRVESFPSNLVARGFAFKQAEFFEIAEETDRAVPTVSF